MIFLNKIVNKNEIVLEIVQDLNGRLDVVEEKLKWIDKFNKNREVYSPEQNRSFVVESKIVKAKREAHSNECADR